MKKKLKKILIPPTAAFFNKIEKCLVRKDMALRFAPIFIVGNPRSGSTLLYQAITRYFNVCYFSNLMMLFPESPTCISRIIAPVNGCNPPYSFYNKYGFTVGLKSPNQGLRFWNRWFPDNYGYVAPEALSKRAKKEIRNTIALIQECFEAPFVNKCQPLSERLLAIVEALPEAVFIRIKREPVFTAQSILLGKRELWNDENRWFSTKPRNYEEIKYGNYLEKICNQVFYIEKNIDSNIEIIGKDKFLTIHYEELCKSPRMVLDSIKSFYVNKNKYRALEVRNEIPLSFRNSNSIKISAKEFKVIEANFLRLKKLNVIK